MWYGQFILLLKGFLRSLCGCCDKKQKCQYAQLGSCKHVIMFPLEIKFGYLPIPLSKPGRVGSLVPFPDREISYQRHCDSHLKRVWLTEQRDPPTTTTTTTHVDVLASEIKPSVLPVYVFDLSCRTISHPNDCGTYKSEYFLLASKLVAVVRSTGASRTNYDWVGSNRIE